MISARTVIIAVTLVVTLVYAGVRVLYYVHMFQLNSYRYKRFFRFVGQNWRSFFPIPGILLIVYLVVYLIWGGLSLATAILGLLFYILAVIVRTMTLVLGRPKTKKPLVYTKRVIRILIGVVVLYALYLVFVPLEHIFYYMILLFMAAPAMLLANAILLPVEGLLKKKYFTQAKQIVQANQQLRRIGITGSYGKTSTKFILETILARKFTTLATPNSYNTTMGVIITIRKSLSRNIEVFIAEMGAKQKGDIKQICDLVQPNISMITAIGPQHLETFKTVENIIQTKFEIVDCLDDTGWAVVNYDDANIRQGMAQYPTKNYITYGQGQNCDYRISEVRQSINGSEFTVISEKGEHTYHTRLLGQHNISNVCGAIAIAYQLGIDYSDIQIGVREIKPIAHRLELKKQGNYYLLDDAFNSNPTGAKHALQVLDQFNQGRKIIMTPGMIELGQMDEAVHIEFGKQISQVCDYVLLIGPKKTKHIYAGLMAAGYDETKISVLSSVYEGFAKLATIVQKEDTVLIENDLPDNFNE